MRLGEGAEDKLMGTGLVSHPSSLGKQPLGWLPTQPEFSFHRRGTRSQRERVYMAPEFEKHFFGSFSPGPQTMSAVSSLGRQTASVRKTSPSASFGSASRFPSTKRLVTPGPDTYL